MVNLMSLPNIKKTQLTETLDASLLRHCCDCSIIPPADRQPQRLQAPQPHHLVSSLRYKFQLLKRKVQWLAHNRKKVNTPRASLLGLPYEIREQIYLELYNTLDPRDHWLDDLKQLPFWIWSLSRLSSVCSLLKMEISDFVRRATAWQKMFLFEALSPLGQPLRLCPIMVENIKSIQIREDYHIFIRQDANFPPSHTSFMQHAMETCTTWFWNSHVVASMPRLKRIGITFRGPDYTNDYVEIGTIGYYLAYAGMLDQFITVQQRCSARQQHKIKLEVMGLKAQHWARYWADRDRTIEDRDSGGLHDPSAWWTEIGADWISRKGTNDWRVYHFEDV